jgi:hypothetical protein
MDSLMIYCISISLWSVRLMGNCRIYFKIIRKLIINRNTRFGFIKFVMLFQYFILLPSYTGISNQKILCSTRYLFIYKGCYQNMWFRMECYSRQHPPLHLLRNSSIPLPINAAWRWVWLKYRYLDNRNDSLWNALQIESFWNYLEIRSG